MKVNGLRADDLAGTGLVAKQRYVVPLWASLIGLVLGGGARLAGRGLLWLVRAWRISLPGLLILGFSWRWHLPGSLAALGALVLAGVLWHRRWPDSFSRHVVRRARGTWRWNTRYRRLWHPAMDGVGLTKTTPARVVYVPQVVAVHSTRVVDVLDVRLLHGHTPDDVAASAEGLRHVFGAYRCKVTETAPGRVRLTMYARDPLTATIPPIAPTASPDLAALPVGLAEDGDPYAARLLGRHILIAGASGAGKGSVLWSLVRALAPAVANGSVRLWGIDPKRMELPFGRGLFARLVESDLDAVADLLDQAVRDMQARAEVLSGVTRQHEATPYDPAIVIVIDELAALTAYVPDQKLKKRIQNALSLLLSQGRAVGFYVIAALQDPRKEVVAFRDLFTVRVALRTTEAEHADLILGDGASDRGAMTHKIPDSLPGVAYVHVEGAHEPVRVRFSYLSDDDIREMAARWPAPAGNTHPTRVIDLREAGTGPSGLPQPREIPDSETSEGWHET
jgi:S-DNA-T family DNA segregation ATPase FtsK/SpoIIIE